MTEASQRAREYGGAALLVGLALALIYPYYDRVLYDHDDGLVGLMAQLTSRGLRSHVEFFDPYSGLLNLWHSAWFRLLGENLRTPRIATIAAFALTVPIVFGTALRIFTFRTSLLVSALWVLWALPQHITALPTWYNVFLNFAVLAIFACYLESRSRGLLLIAGGVTAIAILIKVIGLYLLAGSLLFLLFDSQSTQRFERFRLTPLSLLIAILGTLSTAVTAMVVRRHLDFDYATFFVAPAAFAWFVVSYRESRIEDSLLHRLHSVVIERIGPYVLGVVVVGALWAMRYPNLSEFKSMLLGIFVLPHRRAELITFPLPPLPLLVFLPSALIIIYTAIRRPALTERVFFASIWLVVGALALYRWKVEPKAGEDFKVLIWSGGYYLLLSLAPILLIGVLVRNALATSKHDTMAFLIAAVGSYFQLVMYPFSTQSYFAYCAPLLIFVTATLLSAPRSFPRFTGAFLMALWLIVGSMWVGVIQAQLLAGRSELLDTPRGQVRFSLEQTAALRQVVKLVEARVPSGEAIYAGPDAPEVLFLTNRAHIGGFVIEALESGADDADRVFDRIRASGVDLVVVKHGVSTSFGGELHNAIEPKLRSMFSVEQDFGSYSVLMKSSPASELDHQ